MYKVDREKLSYDLAVAFAKSYADATLATGANDPQGIAVNMLHDFRFAYRIYLQQSEAVFDMKECINSEAPID